jgi:hypothetical protein
MPGQIFIDADGGIIYIGQPRYPQQYVPLSVAFYRRTAGTSFSISDNLIPDLTDVSFFFDMPTVHNY